MQTMSATHEPWRRIYAIADRVLSAADPLQQRRIAEQECEGDARLLDGVWSLVLRANAPPSLFDDAVIPDLLKPPERRDGTRLGPYRIIRELGRGGMGQVYLAERDDGHFRKRVALKVTGAWWGADEALRAHFMRERQILAGLEHPGIARLLDGGESADGVPYLAMEFVDGKPLLEFGAERNLGLNARLRLFLPVCEAVEYAHQHLVVHRDLKPSNILVAEDGVPRLLDFGVARLTDAAGDVTSTGLWHLTPAYASPEQATGTAVTTATDVYSLGVVLYELLTGKLPYDVKGMPVAEALRTVANAQKTPAGRLVPELAGDVEAILDRAMRAEPESRYSGVRELRRDIERYLAGEPVHARSGVWGYRASKWLRRNAWKAVASLVIACAIGGGLVSAFVEHRNAEQRASDARAIARLILNRYLDQLAEMPGSMALRTDMAKDASGYLERMSEGVSWADSPELAREVAAAYRRLADVQGAGWQALGDFDGAARSLRRAVAIRGVLLARSPENADAQLELATDLTRLSTVYGRSHHPEHGPVADQALTLLNKIPRQRMQGTDARLVLIDAHQVRSGWFMLQSDNEEYIRGAQVAASLADALEQDHPEDLIIRIRASVAHAWLAMGLLTTGRDRIAMQHAIREARRAAELVQGDLPAARSVSTGRRLRYVLACALIGSGRAELNALKMGEGSAEAAEQSLGNAMKILAKLAAEDPSERRMFTEYVDAALFHAHALNAAGRRADAVAAARDMVTIAGQSVASMPEGQQPDPVLTEYWEETLATFVTPAVGRDAEVLRGILDRTATRKGTAWDRWRAAMQKALPPA